MSYKLFEITSPSDLDGIAAYLDSWYEPDFVVDQLKNGLDARCRNILVESHYVDKDYRSTYYHYYAKKGHRYEPSCVRLHFFDSRVRLHGDGLQLIFAVDEPDGSASDAYFGFMVLRPTRYNTIGRTVLAPTAIRGFHGCLIESEHKVHLLGHKLLVRGFPYMSQHMDISVCAHAACWGILRHYSERFSKYAECLTYDITRMALEFDPGGLLPSTGLHLGDAERVLAGAGTYPVLVFKSGHNSELFYRQLFAYIESGFPLFAELEHLGHAVTVIGHTGFNRKITQSAPRHFSCDTTSDLVVVDDNYLPYRAVPRGIGDPYGCDHITAFIVPLPEKIYYPAECADGLAMILANEEHLGFNHALLGEPVLRYFLTTAAHFRFFMNKHRSQFDAQLVNIAMELTLPQFVWMIEIASTDQWKNGTVATRVIVDATASPAEELPIFLMHNGRRAYVWHRGGDGSEHYVTLETPSNASLSRMEGNLATY